MSSKYGLIENGMLGEGAFGVVQKAQVKASGELVAIKFLKRDNVKQNKYIESELINHLQLRHPHVIEFKEAFLTREHLCIVMELANSSTLFQRVRESKTGIPEDEARWFFQQLLFAVDYCHKKGVSVRDIKLENCLLRSETRLKWPLLKISDFGYSRNDAASAATSRVGTTAYMAPEVLDRVANEVYDSKKADMWSSGVMLYIMLFCQYPFETKEKDPQRQMLKSMELMRKAQYEIPKSRTISANCIDFLAKLLQPDVSKRLTMEEAFKHPWYTTTLNFNPDEFNKKMLVAPMPENHQTKETIAKLLNAAGAPVSKLLRDMSKHEDGVIEDAIDMELAKHSKA